MPHALHLSTVLCRLTKILVSSRSSECTWRRQSLLYRSLDCVREAADVSASMYLPSHALPSSARVDGATVLHVLKRFWHCRCARQLSFVTPRSPPTCPIFSQAVRLHFRPTLPRYVLATSHVGCECPVALMRLALFSRSWSTDMVFYARYHPLTLKDKLSTIRRNFAVPHQAH